MKVHRPSFPGISHRRHVLVQLLVQQKPSTQINPSAQTLFKPQGCPALVSGTQVPAMQEAEAMQSISSTQTVAHWEGVWLESPVHMMAAKGSQNMATTFSSQALSSGRLWLTQVAPRQLAPRRVP